MARARTLLMLAAAAMLCAHCSVGKTPEPDVALPTPTRFVGADWTLSESLPQEYQQLQLEHLNRACFDSGLASSRHPDAQTFERFKKRDRGDPATLHQRFLMALATVLPLAKHPAHPLSKSLSLCQSDPGFAPHITPFLTTTLGEIAKRATESDLLLCAAALADRPLDPKGDQDPGEGKAMEFRWSSVSLAGVSEDKRRIIEALTRVETTALESELSWQSVRNITSAFESIDGMLDVDAKSARLACYMMSFSPVNVSGSNIDRYQGQKAVDYVSAQKLSQWLEAQGDVIERAPSAWWPGVTLWVKKR